MTADVASLIIAVVAVLLATVSLVVSWWHSRESVQRMREERRAHVNGRGGSSRDATEGGRVFDFWIRNTGRAAAWHVYAWAGHGDGTRRSDQVSIGALWPGDAEQQFSLRIPDYAAGEPLLLFALWKDEETGDFTPASRVVCPLA